MLPQLFILGFLHVLQPGHGQLFVLSSFTDKNLSLKKILQLSLAFGFIHSFFLLFLTIISKSFMIKYHDIYHEFEILFAFAIIFLGFYLIFKYFSLNLHECNHNISNINKSSHNLWFYTLLTTSIIPCPSNITLFLSNFFNHSYWEIFWGIIAYTFGITLSIFLLISIVFIYGQTFIQKLLIKNTKLTYLFSGIIILIIGFIMFWEVIHNHH